MSLNHWKVTQILFVLFIFVTFISSAQPQRSYSSSEIKLLLKKLNTAGTVLYVAAHPDDENTRLLSYLANERCVRTAYVSLTRGDGGQNLIGTDMGPYLGLIRSYELMAARSVDRAEQFFTRAYDFGYSKNPEETFATWGKDKVLDDLVYIIRHYKPDLIVTRFSPDGTGGHGHHTASAILAEDAFDLASDPSKYRHQLNDVQIWSPHALLYNNAGRFRNPDADMSGNIPINVGKYNPLLGKSYGEIAGLSRSMHKSQGFGSRNYKGDMMEYFLPVKGHVPKDDIFDGLDISLNRIKGAESFAKLIDSATEEFDVSEPALILPFLTKAYKHLNEIEDEYWRTQKKKELEELILACSGIWLESNTISPTATANEKIEVQLYAINRSETKVKVNSYIIGDNQVKLDPVVLQSNEPLETKFEYNIDKDQTYTGPYWLKSMPQDGLFDLKDQRSLEKPVDSGHIYTTIEIEINGVPIEIKRPLMHRWTDPVQGEQFRLLEITPDVMVNFTDNVLIFGDSNPKRCKVLVKAGKNQVKGYLTLHPNQDFKIEPSSIPFYLDKKDEELTLEFTVFPASYTGIAEMKAIATVDGKEFDRSLVKLDYDHIPIQMVFPEANMRIANIDLKSSPAKIGYIVGAGDEVAEGLRQIGYTVEEISVDVLEKKDLQQYKAIIAGVRAFNTNKRLFAQMTRLNQYVENGGVFIVQYNTNSWSGPLQGPIGPYEFKVTRERVTDENAIVTFLEPGHPVLNEPNRITQKDFEGWIQERGLYFAQDISQEFSTPLSMADPGEKQKPGSLIIASYGKGFYTYTGLSFFRQIPNGTPGAFRLLTNLVEMGNIQP